jgi:SAM-dependent methyltransferase
VITVVADFTAPFDLPGEGAKLDGLLFANALHFARDAGQVLMRLASGLRSGGRVVIVEYDRRGASRWVPFPIPSSGLSDLMAGAGFTPPIETARQPSAYGGDLYVAYAERVS